MRGDSLPKVGCFALAAVLIAGCANQTPVIPQLHVEPNAAARFLYFDKRAHALLAEQMPAPAPSEAEEGAVEEERAPRTWGAPDDSDAGPVN